MHESASECTLSASIDDEPEKIHAMNFVSAMPRLAASAAMIALVLPSAMRSILGTASAPTERRPRRCGNLLRWSA